MNPHDHTRWLNESDDIDAIRQRQREQNERWNSPEDFDPVAAANQRIMADLEKALDKALPTPPTDLGPRDPGNETEEHP